MQKIIPFSLAGKSRTLILNFALLADPLTHDTYAMNVPPVPKPDPPPTLPPKLNQTSGRRFFAGFLSVCLGLFLADAIISFADDSLIFFSGSHFLSPIRGLVGFFGLLMAIGVFGLIGLTPMVPKRLFLPIPLFHLVGTLVVIPCAIYFFTHLPAVGVVISVFQVAVGLMILSQSQGGIKLRWPLVSADQLGNCGFSWRNVLAFALVNAFVLLPLVAVYLFFFSARAVDHFSEGFVALRPVGITVQVRKYARDDGKVIELFPMTHVANADFYQEVSRTFPTNSIILMEGVTDHGNLLTNKITYKRMARSLGLAEQKETFAPARGEIVPADIDVGQFSKQTLDVLNLVMLVHSQGLNPENVMKLAQFSPPPHFEEQLFDDILTKRNRHLLEKIQTSLPLSDNIMVPWGAAHMPGIAREIQKSGFHLEETHEYFVIRFRRVKHAQNSGG